MTIFLATLGQRPQAITMALDVLLPSFQYELIGLLHTKPYHSAIADAYHQLREVLKRDFSRVPLVNYEIAFANPNHPYGVRGVGEVPIVPPPAAIANAIYNAVGVSLDVLPMSQVNVLAALWKKQPESHGA